MALSVLSSTGGRKSCLTLSLAQSRRARRRKSCLTLPPPRAEPPGRRMESIMNGKEEYREETADLSERI